MAGAELERDDGTETMRPPRPLLPDEIETLAACIRPVVSPSGGRADKLICRGSVRSYIALASVARRLASALDPPTFMRATSLPLSEDSTSCCCWLWVLFADWKLSRDEGQLPEAPAAPFWLDATEAGAEEVSHHALFPCAKVMVPPSLVYPARFKIATAAQKERCTACARHCV